MHPILSNFTCSQVDRLFPFHLIFDKDLSIISAGKSLLKVLPDLMGNPLSEQFLIKRSKLDILHFESLINAPKQLLILESIQKPEILLRGEIEPLQQQVAILFLGNPWLRSLEEMQELGWSLTDFAIHDHLTDMMMLVKTQQNSTDDIKLLLEKISHQKKALQNISSLVESYVHPVVICDKNQKIIWVNDAFTKENGWSSQEVIGQSPAFYLYGQHFNLGLVNEIAKKFELGLGFTNDLLIKNKEEKSFWVQLHGQALKIDKEDNQHYFFIQQNIEKQKEAEKRSMENLQKEMMIGELKSRFVSMASHEFRTPMTIIKLHAELIGYYLEKKDLNKIDSIKEYLATIDREIDRMNELIGDILILGKIESNVLSLEASYLDLIPVIANAIERQNKYRSDFEQVKFQVLGNPVPVWVDGSKISHIVDNLVSNALKYSPGKPPPCLTLTYGATHFEIKVKDYGIGIPKKDQDQIFHSFFRASNTGNIKGTGIGMVVVKSFTDLHNGQIVFSSAENNGTEFTISIPIHSIT